MELNDNQSSTTPAHDFTHLMGNALDAKASGAELARHAHFSRSYFQRYFRHTMGETPVSCQRRLLLERAGYQLLHTQRPVTDIALDAGFESLEGFDRAFHRATGISPRKFRSNRLMNWFVPAPNNIHYDPVIGAALRLPWQADKGVKMDLTDRLIEHDFWLTRRLMESAKNLSDAQLDTSLTDIDNPLLFAGDSRTLRDLLDRLVFTKETWLSSVQGQAMKTNPDRSISGMLQRMEISFPEFLALVKKVRDENLWDTSFMDMQCTPPETFTYGGMIAHVLTFSAYRREVVIDALAKAGVTGHNYGDPLEWEQSARG